MSDARLRRREGVGQPGDAEPDVVEELLREHAFLDRPDDRDEE
jgi:hypothetical protein